MTHSVKDTEWVACPCPCECDDLYRVKAGEEQYAKAYIKQLEAALSTLDDAGALAKTLGCHCALTRFHDAMRRP